jgi:hypothetical protein
MWKTVVALTLLGSIRVAHAQMPEPSVDEPAPVVEQPSEPTPAQAGDTESPDIRPPSSYTPAPAVYPPTRETYNEPEETPPLSGGRLIGEVAIGGLFGAGGIVAGAYIGFGLETQGGCNGEFCGLGGAIVGGAAGLAFVTPLGVYLVGSSDGQTGSLGATIGGSVIGTLVGIAAAAGANENEGLALTFLAAGPIVGSMIGFNATRKYAPGHKAANWMPVASTSRGNTSLGLVGRF